MIIFICFIVWYVIGIICFVRIHTKYDDFTTADIMMAIVVGFLGPTLIIDELLEKIDTKKIIFKKRSK